MSSVNYNYDEEINREYRRRLVEDKQAATDNAFDEYEEAAIDASNPHKLARAEQRFIRLRNELEHLMSSSDVEY